VLDYIVNQRIRIRKLQSEQDEIHDRYAHEELGDHVHYHGVDKAEQHISVQDALETFLKEIRPVGFEVIDYLDSLNRVLAEDIRSKYDVPRYDRSTRDGYAVYVDSGSDQHVLRSGTKVRILGEIRIGKKAQIRVRPGQAFRVATGSFVPGGSNAVVMKEYATAEDGMLSITRDVRSGENILHAGEDIKKDSIVLRRGTTIGPHHVALLALVGVRRVRVFRRPKVAFFSTGDELQDVSTKKKSKSVTPLKTNDINRPFIKSMLNELVAIPNDLGIAKDNFETLRSKLRLGLEESDALILSAGSSVGERDYVGKAAESIRGLKLLIHGVAMRPSSPTGLGVYKGKPFIMLPGFPTSMMISFFAFARPAILRLGGSLEITQSYVNATLEDSFQAREGMTHFLRVKVRESEDGGSYKARIIRPTEAQYSSWLKEANGICILGPSKTTVNGGDTVRVFLISKIPAC
jgi:molybdopterin molybdotransferase